MSEENPEVLQDASELSVTERRSLASSIEPNDIVCLQDLQGGSALWRCTEVLREGTRADQQIVYSFIHTRHNPYRRKDEVSELQLRFSTVVERILPIDQDSADSFENDLIMRAGSGRWRIKALAVGESDGLFWKLHLEALDDTTTQVRPDHYGGPANPHEPIKIIEHYGLNFSLGNSLKYILRAGKKDASRTVEDLEKARTYLDFEIARLKREGK